MRLAVEDHREPAEVLVPRVAWPRLGPPEHGEDRVLREHARAAARTWRAVVDSEDPASVGDRAPARPLQARQELARCHAAWQVLGSGPHIAMVVAVIDQRNL